MTATFAALVETADPSVYEIRTHGPGPQGSLPLTEGLLREAPSGDIFGLTQDVGMGWRPEALGGQEILILSTQGGIRAPDGSPIALGYHTGHWEVGLLMQAAADELRGLGCVPFAGFVTDPCDGRTQGTTGMMDSLPYRNDAAMVLRRLIRSLPTRKGVLGVATCDKGLPAMTMALASMHALPSVMAVHAAVGGSTNLLLHIPAFAYCGGLRRPTIDEWHAVNLRVPRIVDVLPNGPVGHPTVRVFLAGGVPEVMLHLRRLGLLDESCLTVSGLPLGEVLAAWEISERRKRLRERLLEQDGIDPDTVIMTPARAWTAGLTSTVKFPRGNLAPEGSVIKSTSIDPSVVDPDGVYRKTGPARVFTRERDAIAAIKGQGENPIRRGDVVVLIGRGPIGAGMEE